MFALLESEPKKNCHPCLFFFCSAIIFIEEGSVHITMTVCMKIVNYYRAHHYKCVIFQCVLYKHHNKKIHIIRLRILLVTMKRMMMIHMMMMIMGGTICFCYGRFIDRIAAFIFLTHTIYDKHDHQNGTQ